MANYIRTLNKAEVDELKANGLERQLAIMQKLIDATNKLLDESGVFSLGAASGQQAHIADPAAAAALTQNTITDNGAGTADQTVEDVADIALSTTDTYTDAAVNGAVNTAIASISNNFKEMTTELALIKADITAVKAGVDANNAAIDAILAQLAALGLQASA